MTGVARLAVVFVFALSGACSYPSVDNDDLGTGIALPDRPDNDDAGAASTDEGKSTSSAPLPSTSEPDPPDGGQSADAATPPPNAGAWQQANGQECGSFCANQNLTNVPSPEGAKCTSGENIPASALADGITYSKCFPSCGAHLAGANAQSNGGNCYADGQKKDGDASDVTRGCFCK